MECGAGTHLERLLELSGAVVVDGDLEVGRIHAARPETACLGRAPVATLRSRTWSELVHPLDRMRVDAALADLREGRAVTDLQLRHVAPDGSFHWIRWDAVRNGSSFRAIARESGDRHRKLFDEIVDGFCVAEILYEDGRAVDYRFVEANPAFEAQTGLANVVGRRIRDMVPTIERFWIETYARVAETGEPARFESSAPSMDRWFDVYAFRFGRAELRQVAILFRDTTARKRAELRESFLVRLDDALRALNEPERIVETAAVLLGRQLDGDRCAYAEVDPDEDSFVIPGNYTAGLPSIVGRYRLKDFGEEVLRLNRAGEPYVVDDVETNPIAGPDLAAYRATGIRAVISMPLLKAGRFVAGMAVHSKTPRRWTSDEVELLRSVAGRCWESIERARVARALAESEAHLRGLAEAVPSIVWIAQPDGSLTYLNARWTELTGLSIDESLGHGWARALHPDDRPRVLEAWERSHRTGDIYEGDARYRSRDGTYRWHLFRGLPWRDRDGVVRRWYGASLDVQDLRDVDRRFREMMDVAPAIFWVTQPDGTCSFLSRGWYEYTGQSESEALGFGWLNATHPDDAARVNEAFRSANERRSPFSVDYRVRRADGVYRWAVDAARPRFGPQGEFLGFVGSVIDITERKEAEEGRERLLDAERAARLEADRVGRMKDEFLATLSHELRTPLNAILGWAQLLRQGRVSEGNVTRSLEIIERNARLQAKLVADLLDVSRIISGKVRLELARVDLCEVVRTAIESVQPTADAKGVHLRYDDGGVRATVIGDASRLQQIVWNLLSNAVKFTPKSGSVVVELREVDERAELRVVDTGAGIAARFLPIIFERFSQADASSTRAHGGLGLGLSIAKHLTEMHGGDVDAASEGLGRGSSFRVRIPLAQPIAASVSATSRPPAPLRSDLRGLSVLVVDDCGDSRALVRSVLERYDVKVTAAASAKEALDVVASTSPDVLISDIGMPEVDGYELLQRVRARPNRDAGAAMPAIALTAYASAMDRATAYAAGFDAHVAKPLDPDELVRVLASLPVRPSTAR